MNKNYVNGGTPQLGDLIAYKDAAGMVCVGTVEGFNGKDQSIGTVNNEQVILGNAKLLCGVGEVS